MTISRLSSAILGVTGVVFLVMSFGLGYLGIKWLVVSAMVTHLLLILVALPFLLRSVFLLDRPSFEYKAIVTLISLINALLLWVITSVHLLAPWMSVVAILELAPLFLLLIETYVEMYEDGKYLYMVNTYIF